MRKTLMLLQVILAMMILAGCGSEPTFENRLKKLRRLEAEQEYVRAIEELNVLMTLAPTDGAVLYLGGRVYMAVNRPDSAQAYARKLTSLYPDNIQGLELLDIASEANGDYDTQIWAVSQLSYLKGDRRQYFPKLAELNFRRNEYGMAISTCEDILAYDPDNTEVLFILANSLSAIGMVDSAVAIMDRLNREYPNEVEILSNLGAFYVTLKRYDKAEEIFTKLTESYPDYIPGWFGLGNVLVKSGDTSGAIMAYETVFIRDSTFLGVDSILRELVPLGP